MTCAVRHCPGLVTPPHIVCGACLMVIARDRRALREHERLCREAAAMEREERESMKAVEMCRNQVVCTCQEDAFGRAVYLVTGGEDGNLTLKFYQDKRFLTPAQAIDLGQTLIEWGKTGKLEASE